jgi:hypothetical protein
MFVVHVISENSFGRTSTRRRRCLNRRQPLISHATHALHLAHLAADLDAGIG